MNFANGALTEAVYYILLSLLEARHGYGIMQNAEELSHGRVKLAAGTLYGAINTLLEKGWITEKGIRHHRCRPADASAGAGKTRRAGQ